MSTVILDQTQTMSGPVVQGSAPISIPLPKPDSNLSLLINAPGVRYRLEVPVEDNPIIEANKLAVRFAVDDNVYLGLNLVGQSIEQDNEFKVGQFFLYYQIEEQRPRAHFVANTLMAILGLAGKFYLKMSEPEVNTDLNLETSLLEISKMLYRRQTAYRLMVIEGATGKQFLMPPAMSEREIERIAFVYHAIVDHSFIWPGRNFNTSIPATPENASLFAQLVQASVWPVPVEPIGENILGQYVHLGRAIAIIKDAVVTNTDKIRKQLEAADGRLVELEIHSLSGQDEYEFTEIPYSSSPSWEPKIQTLIDLEPYLDAAITERYHTLAAATLAGLTEEEKKEVTTFPDLDEAFIDIDGE
jgi:hypothetical protein